MEQSTLSGCDLVLVAEGSRKKKVELAPGTWKCLEAIGAGAQRNPTMSATVLGLTRKHIQDIPSNSCIQGNQKHIANYTTHCFR